MAPLNTGVEIAIIVENQGPVTLTKTAEGPVLRPAPPGAPDMTYSLSSKALQELLKVETDDVGEIGVAILRLLANSDPLVRMNVKLHIGPFELFRKGYFGVIPLGGPTVMSFLASKGFSSLSKIKAAIGRMRS